MLYILWSKVRDWATLSSGLPSQILPAERLPKLGDVLSQRDWFAEGLLNRLPLVVMLMAVQSLYIPINRTGTDGYRMDWPVIDGAMPLVGEFVVPYVAGIGVIGIMAILAAWFLPRQLFQAFAVSFFIIMVIGFTIWIVFPAYVTKAPFTPGNIFDEWTRDLHVRDRDYGNHNALPSSHVYYITLLLYFFAKKWPRGWFLWVTLAVINAWSTMLTHQHYFLDVLAGFLLAILVLWITYNIILPPLRRSKQKQHRPAISQNLVVDK